MKQLEELITNEVPFTSEKDPETEAKRIAAEIIGLFRTNDDVRIQWNVRRYAQILLEIRKQIEACDSPEDRIALEAGMNGGCASTIFIQMSKR